MDIPGPEIIGYLRELAAGDDEPVIGEMEALAEERNFPIIGRLCGRFLEVMARSIGARRIFEMGSGYGYSAYWFSRATGPAGEIHLTDTDADNQKLAQDFLSRAGLWDPISYHVSDAFSAFDETDGEFDIVYCDIDKDGYPEAWRRAKDRVRIGGYYLCDNTLWSGNVTKPLTDMDDYTRAIDEMNRAVSSDPRYRSFILPLRDGVVAALRIG